jgi:predicted ABC-type ATPase
LHYAKGPDGNVLRDPSGRPVYTPERQKKHREILDALFEGKQRSPTPTAVFVMGPPASGKSSTKRKRNELTRDSVVHIDPDELRVQLPEFEEAVKKRVRNAGSITYEETQHLNNKAVDMAIDGKYDFVMDAAGGTSDKGIEWFAKTMQDLKGKGYNVQVFMHHTPDMDKLLIRNEGRGVRSGRFVPAATIQAAVQNIPKQMAAYEPLVDVFRVFDTSGLDDDPPQEAREVYAKTATSRQVSDPAFMRDHYLVTEGMEGSMDESKRLDMGADAVRDRFIKNLRDDFAFARKEQAAFEPGEGVRWEPFDPTDERMGESKAAGSATPKVGAVRMVNGGFYEYQADGSWQRVDWFS